MLRHWYLTLFLVCLVVHSDVRAAWKYSKKSRKSNVKFQNDAASYGPNVCAIQEVYRTGQKFYPDCVKKRLKKVCGKPTFVRYECCCGYGVVDGEDGCPELQPVKNLRETMNDLGLTQFPKLLTNTELEYRLKEEGAYTVFVPIDEAFNKLTHDQKQRVFPWTYNALSLLHYHVVPGWHHSDHMKKSEFLPTLYYGLKPIWANRVTKKDVHTVNCARIIRSNVLASNGVIHLIDQMLQVYDMFGNMTDVMFRDSSQFSQFIQVLYTSEIFSLLREGGPFTLFAPSNYAFSRLPPLLLERVLREQITAEALVRHHTAPGIFCSSAIIDKGSVRMLDGSRMKFQCKESGHYIDNSKIVKPDLVAGNGVIHIINKIQLPSEIQTMEGVARQLRLTKFLQYCYESGLLDKLQGSTEMTIFAPSDEAFSDLPKERKQDLARDPTIFEAIFDYASSIGKIKTDNFVGDHGIIMNSGNIMKISIHRDGILMDDASITSPNHECSNGIIHVIDKVLSPPVNNIFDIIEYAEDLSIFKKGLEYGELTELLKNRDASFTVFAPVDQAFNKLPVWQFDAIFDKTHTVKMLIQHHIISRILINRAITPETILRIQTLQNETIVFKHGKDDKFFINTYSDILGPPIIANNGVLYRIDRVLECECDKDPR
ncbi:periostin-like [Ruditapes philippinarum]|uniref:periostin-like n=1 Tax=Ruditapes philippinarum TaxID=129788 RepID=UPI00295C1D28|nr:periostin-like [Ruditapes philippinarum]